MQETFSALIPLLAPLLASGVVYAANKLWTGPIAKWPNVAKQGLVVVLSGVAYIGLSALGLDATLTDVSTLSKSGIAGLLEGVLVAIVYKLGAMGSTSSPTT